MIPLFLFTFFFFCSSVFLNEECSVVVVGGSLSAFASSFSSASMGVKTCLIEPTGKHLMHLKNLDWIGGQMTASGVSAIDFAWHTLIDKKTGKKYPVWKFARNSANLPSSFNVLMDKVTDTGNCWVSIDCFLPKIMIKNGLDPLYQNVSKNLRIYLNTVIKRVELEKKGNLIKSITVIQRIAKNTTKCKGYDIFLSEDIKNWYNEEEDKRYHKNIIKLNGKVFVEASEFGELLALSGTRYLQGIAEKYDGDISREGNETCGQSFTFGFCEKVNETEVQEPPNPYPVYHEDFYSLNNFTSTHVWTYRRLINNGDTKEINTGDISLQNWGRGNDYSFKYLFKSYNNTQKEIKDNNWSGGVEIGVLRDAEYLAYGYHYYYKNQTELEKFIYMKKSEMGTCHGLSKYPYVRDTRRSIGLNNFLLKIGDISGDFTQHLTGTKFYDSVGMGVYDVDIHSIKGCDYPEYMQEYYPILPFYIPFRAMTNYKIENMIVTGKSIAQSFLVSSASRVHPVEYSTGVSSGVISAFMINEGIFNTEEVLMKRIADLQKIVENYNPINWNLNEQF